MENVTERNNGYMPQRAKDVYKRQVQRLVLIGCYVVMGFMQGYQPVASYSFGANKEERFHESVRFALRTSLILTVLVAGIYILLARPLIMLFNRNPAVIDYGARLLISQVALYPAFGLCYICLLYTS